MDVSVTKASDGRTKIRIHNKGPGAFTEQRFRLYPPDYNGSNPIDFELSGGLASLTWEFYIEDYADRFISYYPSQSFGTFAVGRETRYTAAWVGSTGWSEVEKQEKIHYNIYANAHTAPIISSTSVSPTETLLDDSSLYVKTKNGVTVSEIKADGQLGASLLELKWYLSTDPAKKYKVGDSSDKFLSYGEITLTIEVTDSRGIASQVEIPLTVHDYAPPRVSPVEGSKDIKAERSGANIAFSLGKRYSDVGGHNKCKLAYSLRAIFETKWGDAATLLDENSPSNDFAGEMIENLNDRTIYYVEVVAKDSFGGIGRVVLDIPTDEVFIHKSANLNSIGLGGPTSLENALEVFFETHLYNVSQLMLTSPGGKSFLLTIDDDGVISTKDVSTTTFMRGRIK